MGNGQGGIQERELKPFASPQGSSLLLPEEDTDVLDGMEDDIFYREIVKSRGKVVPWEILQHSLCRNFFTQVN